MFGKKVNKSELYSVFVLFIRSACGSLNECRGKGCFWGDNLIFVLNQIKDALFYGRLDENILSRRIQASMGLSISMRPGAGGYM